MMGSGRKMKIRNWSKIAMDRKALKTILSRPKLTKICSAKEKEG
jgi:hypothetical protein